MSNRFVQRGGWWVVGQFILMFVVAVLDVACRDESKHLLLFLCGLLFLTVSLVCAIGGMMALGRNLTPFPKPSAGTELVQRGVYGLIRHPLYMAVIGTAVGWSLMRSSWPAFTASLALAIFFDAKARHEERWLRQRFPDYAHYQQHVRRFIPWIY